MSFDTAGNIIADSAVELGLVAFANKPSDVFGSTDPNIGLLCQLIKSVGRDLMREHQWTNLQNFWVFQTTSSVGRYALPSDYDRVIDQTTWNRSIRLPLQPASPQVFEYLKGRMASTTYNILWRVLQGKFHAYPDDTTPGSYTISYEYMSRWWVIPSGTQSATAGPWLPGVAYSSSTPDYVLSGGNIYRCTQSGTSGTTAALAATSGTITDGTCHWTYVSAAGADTSTANNDTIQFDPQLVRAALKYTFRAERGLEAQGALSEYQSSLSKAISADTIAPVLSFTPGSFSEPLLGPWNLPTTGTTS